MFHSFASKRSSSNSAHCLWSKPQVRKQLRENLTACSLTGKYSSEIALATGEFACDFRSHPPTQDTSSHCGREKLKAIIGDFPWGGAQLQDIGPWLPMHSKRPRQVGFLYNTTPVVCRRSHGHFSPSALWETSSALQPNQRNGAPGINDEAQHLTEKGAEVGIRPLSGIRNLINEFGTHAT